MAPGKKYWDERRSTTVAETITGVVIARNEAHQLAACLASLAGVDALVVVDHASDDGTAEVAQAAGAQVLRLEGDLADLRTAGTRAAGTWVVALDADERLPAGGLQAIQAAIAARRPEISVFELPIATWLGPQRLRFGGYRPWRIRVYRADAVTWPPARVHERPVFQGLAARLPVELTHHCYRDWGHVLEKTRRYAAWGALSLQDAGRKRSTVAAAVRAAWRWLRVFCLQGGWLMGRVGLRLAGLQARGVWWRLRWSRQGVPAAAARSPAPVGFAREGVHLRN